MTLASALKSFTLVNYSCNKIGQAMTTEAYYTEALNYLFHSTRNKLMVIMRRSTLHVNSKLQHKIIFDIDLNVTYSFS